MTCEHESGGKRCRAFALRGSDPPRCIRHSEDPEVIRRREESDRKGGAVTAVRTLPATTLPPRLYTAGDVRDLLAETIQQVRTGAIDTRTANAVGYLASVLLRAVEGHDLEARLEALEGAPAGVSTSRGC